MYSKNHSKDTTNKMSEADEDRNIIKPEEV